MPSVNLSPLFNGQTMFGPTGLPLANGRLYTYQAGSSTPWATYTTFDGNVANSNPIILGSDAKLPNELWLQSGYSYKYVLKDENEVIIATYDNIAGILTQIPSSSASVPTGCILVWSGATGSIPSGFVICDGTNGTPDLRDRFIIGAGLSYAVGETGGSADAIVVTHSHTATSSTSTSITDPGHYHGITDPGHSHTANESAPGSPDQRAFIKQNNAVYVPVADPYLINGNTTGITINTASTGISASSSTTTTTANAGQSGTGANLPPYYALAFIMKT